jgi:lysophospholipase L1-like esterase
MKKFTVFLIGLFITICSLEIGIRVFGFFYNKNPNTAQREIDFDSIRILCIGNSHTAGSGVNIEQAYPAVLEDKLKRIFPHKKFQVFNGGLGNANTSILLDALPEQLNQIKPHLLIIMAGEPNDWNAYGFSRFLKSKQNNKSILNSKVFFKEDSLPLLYKLRIFRMMTVLFNKENITSETASFNSNEKMMFLKSSLEIPSINTSSTNAIDKRDSILKYLNENNLNEIADGRDYYILLYKLYISQFHDWSKAIEAMEKSINLKSTFDFITFYEINNLLENQKHLIPAEIKEKLIKLNFLNKQKDLTNAESSILSLIYPFGDLSSLSLKQLEVGKKYLPGLSNLSFHYITKLKKEGKINSEEMAHKIEEALLLHGPFCMQSNALISNLKELAEQSHHLKFKNDIHLFFKEMYQKYPHSYERINLFNDNLKKEWIEFDMKQILDLAKSKNIKTLIQSYHWLRGSTLDMYLYSELLSIANQNQVPFSDTRTNYVEKIKSSHLNEREFFVLRYGEMDNHPSARGHQVIANKLVSDIIHYKLLPSF